MDIIDQTVDYLHSLAEQSAVLRAEGDFASAFTLDEEGAWVASAIREFTKPAA
mgnify:CR=1 FL=1